MVSLDPGQRLAIQVVGPNRVVLVTTAGVLANDQGIVTGQVGDVVRVGKAIQIAGVGGVAVAVLVGGRDWGAGDQTRAAFVRLPGLGR